MQALISPLPAPYSLFVRQMWTEIQNEFGIDQQWRDILPHFTWQVAECYEESGVLLLMDAFTKRNKVFTVETTGLGRFDADKQVLFIEIQADTKLKALHREMWDLLFGFMQDEKPYYAPDYWHPHITLAISENLIAEKINEIARYFSGKEFTWQFEINRLLFAAQEGDDDFVTKHAFFFGQGLVFSHTQAMNKNIIVGNQCKQS